MVKQFQSAQYKRLVFCVTENEKNEKSEKLWLFSLFLQLNNLIRSLNLKFEQLSAVSL